MAAASLFAPAARFAVFLVGTSVAVLCPAAVVLDPPETLAGYVTRLLVNETPFPGEEFWIAEADTRAAQIALVNVVRNRLHHIPAGYSQHQLAAITTTNAFDLITAGGVHGQVEGFYRNAAGAPVFSDHVRARVDYLVAVANRGQPGTFARLLEHAQTLARGFASEFPTDPFLSLREIEGEPVTGRAYGWMTDREYFRPGGRFVKITDQWGGGRGGNRFFTLKAQP